MHKQKMRIRRCILAVILFAAACIGYHGVSIWSYSRADEKQPADAVIVLGAGADVSGQVSPVFAQRLNHGVWLYQHGYGKKLILTGGVGQGGVRSDASAAKDYVTAQGVPVADILLEERSKITQQNLEYAKKLMEQHDLSTAVLVSDPLHMKRAMVMAADCGITAYSSPTPTTRYQSLKTKLPFFFRELFYYIGYRFWRLF